MSLDLRRRLALIPVDARPVTCDLPGQIAAIAGWEVVVPDRDLLGFLKTPGKRDQLLEWLQKVAAEVDGFVLSLDMIGYGGLVPSRVIEDDFASIWSRLEQVLELKRQYPEKLLYAFSATMRISNNYVNEEEKEYWNRYGEEIWQYSYHSHRFEKTALEDSWDKVTELKTHIPKDILDDYLKTRERNFKVNKKLLDKVEEGLIDILIFPQDDTSEYGLNIREQEELSCEVESRQLFDHVLLYPGADEVGTTLTARAILELEGVEAPVFYPFYSGEKGKLQPAMYEDRPIAESVKGQIFAIGGYTVDTASESNVVLAVNVPGMRQGDLALQKNLQYVDTNGRNVGEWLHRITRYQDSGYPIAVADLAYANGADPVMMARLLRIEDSLARLVGFGAWNTAGNTLGTVVSQAAMHHLSDKLGDEGPNKEWKEQLFLRLLDDYLYQTIVRQKVRKEITGQPETEVMNLREIVEKQFMEDYQAFIQNTAVQNLIKGININLKSIYLPWNRTFEIGIEWGTKWGRR